MSVIIERLINNDYILGVVSSKMCGSYRFIYTIMCYDVMIYDSDVFVSKSLFYLSVHCCAYTIMPNILDHVNVCLEEN